MIIWTECDACQRIPELEGHSEVCPQHEQAEDEGGSRALAIAMLWAFALLLALITTALLVL